MTARVTLKKVLAPFIFSFLILLSTQAVLAKDATSSSPAKLRKEEVKQKVETRVEKKKEATQQKIEAMKEKIASREATLKLKLEKFKDKEKAAIAERVNTNLNKINEKMVLDMSKFLERVSVLLDKLESRVNQGSPDIKNAALAKQSIAEARTAITTAQDDVKAQSEKNYTLAVTSETRIKTDATNMRKQLHLDLQTVRKLVIEAKQTVANAIRVAKTGMKVEEATESGT